MNQVNLIGNLTRDPEITETSGGVKVCSDGERKTDYFNCVAWRGLAETVAKYTKKGNKIRITGSIETRVYEDSQGVKRTGVDIVAQDVEFLTSKTSAEDDAASKHLQPINDDDTDIPF